MVSILKLKFFSQREEEINFDSFIKFPLLIFRIIFVNFKPRPANGTIKEKIKYYARRTYNKFAIILLLWMLTTKVILLISAENLLDAFPFLLDVASYILVEFKIIHMILIQDDIWGIFQEMRFIFNHRPIKIWEYGVKKYLGNFHRLILIMATPIGLLLAFFLSLIIPYLVYGVMILPIPYWYPFDPFQLHTYPFAYLFVNVAAITGMPAILASDTLFYAIITVLAMEFDILKMDLSHFGEIVEAKMDYEMLVHEMVDRHNKLLDLTERIQTIFAKTFFLTFVISSLIICFITFHLSNNVNDGFTFAVYFAYLWFMVAQIFLLCIFGQKLINSLENFADGIYNCGWENLHDIRLRKQLMMIIRRSQKIKPLSAMGFANISLETFAAVSLSEVPYFLF